MIKKLKRERTALIICIALSYILFVVYSMEGINQIEALEHQVERQAAQLKDLEEIFEVQDLLIMQQDLLFEMQDDVIHKLLTKNEPELAFAGEFEITYYCACYECCGKTDGITASGTIAQEGITVAADWDILPVGTKIYIDGIGYRTVEDKGGVIKGNTIDVFMNSHSAALEAGRHKADVLIVEDNNEI